MTFEEKAQRIESLRWIINTRWLTVTLFLVFTEIFLRFIFNIDIPVPISIRIGIPLFFYFSTFYFLWLLRDRVRVSTKTVSWISSSIVPVDLVIFTVILYFLGGVGSYSVMFYFFAVIVATAVYSPRGIILTATASSLLTLGEYALEKTGILGPSPLKETLAQFLVSEQDIETGYLVVFIANIHIAAILLSFMSTGFKRTFQDIIEERNRISLILDALPDPVIILDDEDRVILMNRNAEKLTGLTTIKAKNIHITKALIKSNSQYERLDTIIKQKVGFYQKSELKLEIPYEIIYQLTLIPLYRKRGKESQIVGTIRILHDISREKTISRLKSEFISIAAHQLRTPLSAIKWTLKMMADGDVGTITDEQKAFLNRGYDTNERMIKLVSDLLNVSRIEEGRFGYEFVKFSIEKVVEDLIQDYTTVFDKKKLRFTYKKPETPLPLIKIDPQRMRLAIQNILENAIHYTLPKGKIILKIEKGKSNIIISVKDTGIGIPKHQRGQLFTKFFRAENVMRMQTEGSGLGLYIVKNVLKRHGGDIKIDSQEGVGTTVSLFLPRKEQDVPDVEVPVEK